MYMKKVPASFRNLGTTKKLNVGCARGLEKVKV
jgi:hypothetical protein